MADHDVEDPARAAAGALAIARLELPSRDVWIDELSPEQGASLSSWTPGT